jgi:hypothetical protein
LPLPLAIVEIIQIVENLRGDSAPFGDLGASNHAPRHRLV